MNTPYISHNHLCHTGLIIIGYQGIGKSSYAQTSTRKEAIDLESSLFYCEGHRPEEWEKIYCNVAMSLASNGYTIFISSHRNVINELIHSHSNDDNFSIVIVTPSHNLKDDWIAKLHYRYVNDNTDKNYRAYIDAQNNFTEEVNYLTSIKEFSCIQIDFMNYEFAKIVRGLQSMYGVYGVCRCRSMNDSNSDDSE